MQLSLALVFLASFGLSAAATSSSGLHQAEALATLLDHRCVNLVFGLSREYGARAFEAFSSSSRGNLLLDPSGFLTFFGTVAKIAKLQIMCFTAVTNPRQEFGFQRAFWWARVKTLALLGQANSTRHPRALQLRPAGGEQVLLQRYCPTTKSMGTADVWSGRAGSWRRRRSSGVCPGDHRSPLSGAVLTAAHASHDPFMIVEGAKVEEGIAIDLMEIIAKKLDFKIEYKLQDSFAKQEEDGSVSGVIEKVASGKVDMGFDAPVNHLYKEVADYGGINYIMDYVFTVRRPERLPPIKNHLYPFDLPTWILLAATVGALAAAMAVLKAGSPKDETDGVGGTLQAAAFVSVGILFQEYTPLRFGDATGRAPKITPLRILWVFVAFLIVMSYSSNLKASLISADYQRELETIEEVLATDAPIFTIAPGVEYMRVSFANLDRRIHAQIEKMNSSIPMTDGYGDKMISLVMENGGSFMHEEYFVEWKRSEHLRKELKLFPLKMVKQRWMQVYHGLIFRRGSVLPDLIEPVVKACHDYGIVAKAIGDWIPYLGVADVEEKTDGRLSMAHFQLVFTFLGAAVAINLFVLFLELVADGCTNRK